MKKHNNIVFIVTVITLLLSFFKNWAQIPTTAVVNNAGTSRTVDDIYLADNTGELFIQQYTNGTRVTEGYLQPIKTKLGFSATVIKQDIICMDKEADAFIAINVKPPLGLTRYELTYIWNNTSFCNEGNCSRIDSLKPGQYEVTVAITYTTAFGQKRFDTLRTNPINIYNADAPCKINFYTTVTANGDGANDIFYISNITEFPKNSVKIYNRWGAPIASVSGYDNSNKVFPSNELKETISEGTYFFIIDLGDATRPYKGWLELIKAN